MSTISEIETALSTLSVEQKYAVYRFLEEQLPFGTKSEAPARSHGVLEIAPVRLGHALPFPGGEDQAGDQDLLSEMLEGRALSLWHNTGIEYPKAHEE